MNNKHLGIILIIAGIIIASTIYYSKSKEDIIISKIVEEQGSCFLEDDTCLHEDRTTVGYTIGWIFSAAIIALGFYLIFFEKSQKAIISTLEKQKQVQDQDEKFNILLKGLDEFEKKVMNAVKEQDGITQQTLRLRTDMHKSKLSVVLDNLEKKELVKRVQKGKTKQVYLKIGL